MTSVGLYRALQIFVYRSPIVRDTDKIFKPVLELLGDAELIIRQTIPDPWMMRGKAEVSVYVKGTP
ncbi:hypothetical protein [Nocardia abscessus]|uniref:hypothetical protein n=1 Tax=Nocardia abscessus TaxID=120957 RepID=UPI003CC7CF60